MCGLRHARQKRVIQKVGGRVFRIAHGKNGWRAAAFIFLTGVIYRMARILLKRMREYKTRQMFLVGIGWRMYMRHYSGHDVDRPERMRG